jgi:hypothetical protein
MGIRGKNMSISLIIPWRDNGQEDRSKITRWCLARYKFLFPSAELIICDSGDKIFSRGKSINKGVKECSGDYVIITDTDYLFDKSMAHDIVNKQPWTIAVKNKNYFYINQGTTDLILSTMTPNSSFKNFVFKNNIEPCPFFIFGGLMAMPTENFLRVQFDPYYKGYGYEDNQFYFSMKTVFGEEYRTGHEMYHLAHNRILGSEYMIRSYENKNYYDRTLKPILDNKEKIQEYINGYQQRKIIRTLKITIEEKDENDS